MLPKNFRLPPKSFDKVYRNGVKKRGNYGMIVYVENEVNNPRFGFVVSKKIGNAVFRHRMTRLLRVVMMEIVNEKNLHSLAKDFQYIAFKFCDKKNVLKEDILNLFKDINND